MVADFNETVELQAVVPLAVARRFEWVVRRLQRRHPQMTRNELLAAVLRHFRDLGRDDQRRLLAEAARVEGRMSRFAADG